MGRRGGCCEEDSDVCGVVRTEAENSTFLIGLHVLLGTVSRQCCV